MSMLQNDVITLKEWKIERAGDHVYKTDLTAMSKRIEELQFQLKDTRKEFKKVVRNFDFSCHFFLSSFQLFQNFSLCF